MNGEGERNPPVIVTTKDLWIEIQDIKDSLSGIKESRKSIATELKFHLLILVAYAGMFAYIFLK